MLPVAEDILIGMRLAGSRLAQNKQAIHFPISPRSDMSMQALVGVDLAHGFLLRYSGAGAGICCY
jgi:hypothetical protein